MTKKPCPKDLEILSYLEKGHKLSGVKIQKLFNCIDHRDSIHRLRRAGNLINSDRIKNPTPENPLGWYVEYSMKKSDAA